MIEEAVGDVGSKTFQNLLQVIKMQLHGIPDHDHVNPQIFMCQDIPHPGNLAPGHVRPLFNQSINA
jgi:hypothetical protein